MNINHIKLRQKFWWMNFSIGVFLFGIVTYFLVDAQLEHGKKVRMLRDPSELWNNLYISRKTIFH